MTQRLYYTDSYLREFDASVVDRDESGRRVYLDRTAFYPTSGGQPFDTGRLGGVEVLDVADEGDRIAHLLAKPFIWDRARGQVDWARRFDHMQQHTGQHLLSAVIEDLFGWATVSVHFGKDVSTLDLATESFTPEQIVTAEQRANAIAVENRPVELTFEEAASVDGLRKVSAREGTLRIVTIRDLDRSACGGTHVRATGEIGPILLGRTERVKKQVRLEFLCGARAVRRARADRDLLVRLATPLSASLEELPGLLEAQRAELKEAAAVRRAVEEELDGYCARELYAAAEPGASGIRTVAVRSEPGGIDRLRGLARAVSSLSRGLFVGTMLDPPSVLLASSEDSG
ncbi:MAG: alanyl-tRNA editing protein, partial [Gemmatimonadales bacterium]